VQSVPVCNRTAADRIDAVTATAAPSTPAHADSDRTGTKLVTAAMHATRIEQHIGTWVHTRAAPPGYLMLPIVGGTKESFLRRRARAMVPAPIGIIER
jgi:hypothetical protein